MGLTRTAGGVIVSGSSMRGNVPITGDERGGSISITGEADPTPQDDVTPRAQERAPVTSYVGRQMNPHGLSPFGATVDRTARSYGSRERRYAAPAESTDGGLAITGSALGRASRITGDEVGVCRHVTGNQYLTPPRAQAECGGSGGGTATGATVGVFQTWGAQRLTGTNVEHDPRITGEAAGSRRTVTGTSYQGPGTVDRGSDAELATATEERRPRRAAPAAVTGNVPRHSDSVTGTGRGAARDITGSPYFREVTESIPPGPEDVIAGIDSRFSVASPQRTSQLGKHASLKARAANDGRPPSAEPKSHSHSPITGSFAVGQDRVTGNAEFEFRSRTSVSPDTASGRSRLTGEGRTTGASITGGSWTEQSNVTGTEGAPAAGRNMSERAGKPQAFSGTRRFKTLAKHEETKQLVTGLLGWSGKTAAKVTLSGGAQA